MATSAARLKAAPGQRDKDCLLKCPICYDFMKTTLMIVNCSHNFCSLCIRLHLTHKTSCPICNINTVESDLKSNRLVDEIIQQHCSSPETSKLEETKKNLSSNRRLRTKSNQSKEACPIVNSASPQAKKCKKKPIIISGESDSDQENVQAPVTDTDSHDKEATTSTDMPRLQPCSNETTDMPQLQPCSNETTDMPQLQPCSSESNGATPTDMSQPQPCSSGTAEQEDATTGEESESVDCPVCGQNIKQGSINVHLDNCLSSVEKKTALRSTPKRKPMAKLVYNIMSEKALRKKLNDVGLSTKGDKQVLTKRHHDFVIMYNAECDALSPRPVNEIVKELQTQEKAKNSPTTLFTNTKKLAVNKNSTPSSIQKAQKAYEKYHKSQFDLLTEEAKARMRRRAKVSVSTSSESRRNTTTSISTSPESRRNTRMSISTSPESRRNTRNSRKKDEDESHRNTKTSTSTSLESRRNTTTSISTSPESHRNTRTSTSTSPESRRSTRNSRKKDQDESITNISAVRDSNQTVSSSKDDDGDDDDNLEKDQQKLNHSSQHVNLENVTSVSNAKHKVHGGKEKKTSNSKKTRKAYKNTATYTESCAESPKQSTSQHKKDQSKSDDSQESNSSLRKTRNSEKNNTSAMSSKVNEYYQLLSESDNDSDNDTSYHGNQVNLTTASSTDSSFLGEHEKTTTSLTNKTLESMKSDILSVNSDRGLQQTSVSSAGKLRTKRSLAYQVEDAENFMEDRNGDDSLLEDVESSLTRDDGNMDYMSSPCSCVGQIQTKSKKISKTKQKSQGKRKKEISQADTGEEKVAGETVDPDSIDHGQNIFKSTPLRKGKRNSLLEKENQILDFSPVAAGIKCSPLRRLVLSPESPNKARFVDDSGSECESDDILIKKINKSIHKFDDQDACTVEQDEEYYEWPALSHPPSEGRLRHVSGVSNADSHTSVDSEMSSILPLMDFPLSESIEMKARRSIGTREDSETMPRRSKRQREVSVDSTNRSKRPRRK